MSHGEPQSRILPSLPVLNVGDCFESGGRWFYIRSIVQVIDPAQNLLMFDCAVEEVVAADLGVN